MGTRSTIATICTMLATGLGLLFDAFGSKTIMATAVPLLTALLPFVGIFLITFALAWVFVACRSWAQQKADTLIRELSEFSRSADRLISQVPSREEQAQFAYYVEKFGRWFPVGMKMDTYAQRAAWFSEAFRIHGYWKGLKIVRKSVKEWPTK